MLLKHSKSIIVALRKNNPLSTLAAIGITTALLTLSALYVANESSKASASENPKTIRISPVLSDLANPTGIADYRPSRSILVSSREPDSLSGFDRIDSYNEAGERRLFSRSLMGDLGTVYTIRNGALGFRKDEIFLGTGRKGEISRGSAKSSYEAVPWITLPGEDGIITGIAEGKPGLYEGQLIAVTSAGSIWRIDDEGFAVLIADHLTAGERSAEGKPISFSGVKLLPDDAVKYGHWAGRILTLSTGNGLLYAVDSNGRVETFDPGIDRIDSLEVFQVGGNFYGLTVDNKDPNQGTLWGVPATDLAGMAGNILLAQSGSETCRCAPSLWSLRWNGTEFSKSQIVQLPSSADGMAWKQTIFSLSGIGVITQQNGAVPVIGPFNQPSSTGPTDNNDDFQLPDPGLNPGQALINGKIAVSTDDNKTIDPLEIRFINTFQNVGNSEGNFIISAPTIPPGVIVKASFNRGDTPPFNYTQIDATTTITATNVKKSGEGDSIRNLDVLVTVPPGTPIDQILDITIQISSDTNSAINNKSIDRILIVKQETAPPNLNLLKSVTDLNGGQVLPGDLLEYTLVLSNPPNSPAATKSFIAEFIPKTLSYLANSVSITGGANLGAKTDAIDGDQVDLVTHPDGSEQLNIATGTGAGGHGGDGLLIGGTLQPGESNTVKFRARVKSGNPPGTVIGNGADWGANDIYPGGKSNIPVVTVSGVLPLIGPFGNAEAVGPTSNNDDFQLLRVDFGTSNGLTNRSGQVRFLNTLKNVGDAPGRYIISAPVIPAGFSVLFSIDSGNTFTSLDNGGTVVTPTAVNPQETRNLDVRVVLPTGLMINTDYDIVIQATSELDPTFSNLTIDRIRPILDPPDLALVKGVRDLQGNNIDGGRVQQGQTIEYSLTLTNNTGAPLAKTFMAEFLPPEVTYVAGSVRITAGANQGAKTDLRGDDQVDYYSSAPANGQINIFTGTGAGPDLGGTLAPGESATAVFRVTIKPDAPFGVTIFNGADWGAEDIYAGGKSNITTVTVVAGPSSLPLIGPFGNAEAVGPTDNNDDFQLLRVDFGTSSGLTNRSGQVRFLNTLKNSGNVADTYIISAPVIPAGFSVLVSIDSGNTFTSLSNGGTVVTPTAVNPQETRNLDVRVVLPTGLMINTDYDVVIQATSELDPTFSNLTIDRIRPILDPPNLQLVKGVRDLQGNNIDGGSVQQGQTIEYSLTLTNNSSSPVAKTFIAEYLPPEVIYMAGSVVITAGANQGMKTDLRGDDQVDYYSSIPANGQLNIFTGTGAAADLGGTLAPGESSTAVFTVTVKPNIPVGTMILNGADWGAEDAFIGKSNIVTVIVTAVPPCPTITVSPGTGALPAGKVGDSYSQTFTQTGGAAPVIFSLDAGTLPPGLNLNQTTGQLTGNPTVSGDYSFTIKATDANGCPGIASYMIRINPTAPVGDGCRPIICFRSAAYFNLNFGTNAIPNGSVQIISAGINSGARVATNHPTVKLALSGRLGDFNREFVAFQLNVLNAGGGLGSATVVTALKSALSCYGLDFDPIDLFRTNQRTAFATWTPGTTMAEVLNLIDQERAIPGTLNLQTRCIIEKIFRSLNGNSLSSACHLVSGRVDFTSCQ